MGKCLDLLRLQVKRWLDGKSKWVWSNICFLVDVCLCHNHHIIQQGWQRLLRRGFWWGRQGRFGRAGLNALGRARLGEPAPALPTLCLALAVANSSSHQCNTLMFTTTCMWLCIGCVQSDLLCFNFPKPSSAFCCFLKPLPKYINELWPKPATFAGVQISEQKGPKSMLRRQGFLNCSAGTNPSWSAFLIKAELGK